jgi:hypothetical protein
VSERPLLSLFFPEAPGETLQHFLSPERDYPCDGSCVRASRTVEETTANVVCLSACADREMAWEDMSGATMTSVCLTSVFVMTGTNACPTVVSHIYIGYAACRETLDNILIFLAERLPRCTHRELLIALRYACTRFAFASF